MIFLLPCLTKSLIIANFSQNFASKLTFVRLRSSYCRVLKRIIASRVPRYFNLKALNCCGCSIEMLLKTVLANGLRSHFLTSVLNGGLSVTNNRHHRFLLRRSEGKYRSAYHRKHSKAAFRR